MLNLRSNIPFKFFCSTYGSKTYEKQGKLAPNSLFETTLKVNYNNF